MNKNNAYSQKEFFHAVNISAVVAWAIVEIVISAEIGFSTLPWNSIWGLPIAFVAVWILGAPFILLAMRNNISYMDAAVLGVKVTSICAFIYTIVMRGGDLLTGATRIAPESAFNAGQLLVVDGYLTMAGARQLIGDVVIYLCAGLVIGMVVRVIVGPGEKQIEETALNAAQHSST